MTRRSTTELRWNTTDRHRKVFVIMMVADVLAPVRHQDISNHHVVSYGTTDCGNSHSIPYTTHISHYNHYTNNARERSGSRQPVSSWWCHQMEIFSALLALCEGNSPVTGKFPPQRPVTLSFDVFFDICLSKQSRRRWFETPSRPLWRHCNLLYCWQVRFLTQITPHGTMCIFWGIYCICYGVV